MQICGQDFNFSALNANDIERMEAAQAHMKQASAAEDRREHVSYAERLRGQCRLVMDFLDEVLGEGASALLGLDGNDFGACQKVVENFRQNIETEKTQVQQAAAPALNRAQRRAQKQAQQRTRTAGRIVVPEVRVAKNIPAEKSARRKALLAELAALENE